MRVAFAYVAAVTIAFLGRVGLAAGDGPSQQDKKKSKATKEATVLDPWDRPDGSIHDQTARYYVWYDKQGWHLRTTSKKGRHFHGKVRVKDARIASCLSVGIKDDKQKAIDSWRVNAARSELQYDFKTGRLSDGLDFVVEGDGGEIEFELYIDNETSAKTIFVGRGLQHPDKSPFTLPAVLKKASEPNSPEKKS